MSPVLVQPYTLPTDSKQGDFLRRMHLENGVEVRGTHWITPADVGSRDLFILDITQSMEGGFDSVNIYDRGVLSWGIMQWTARTGSLTGALVFIKRRLWATHRKRIWDKVFTANGLDADPKGLIAFGKRLQTPQDVRLAFRGTMQIGKFDPKIVTYWATMMARAGRHPAVVELQVEYAGRVVDAVLNKRILNLPYRPPGLIGLSTSALAGSDPYAEALVFVLWTNNPRHALLFVRQAARSSYSISRGKDPAAWDSDAFAEALLRLCHQSRFGNWQARAARTTARRDQARRAGAMALTPFERRYQTVLAAQKSARLQKIASRAAAASRKRDMLFFSNEAKPDPLNQTH